MRLIWLHSAHFAPFFKKNAVLLSLMIERLWKHWPSPSPRAPPPLSFLCLCIKASISSFYLLQRSLLPCSVKLKRHVKCHWTPPNGNRMLPALVSHIMTQLLAGIKHAPPRLSPHAPCQLTCLESRNILAPSMHANPQSWLTAKIKRLLQVLMWDSKDLMLEMTPSFSALALELLVNCFWFLKHLYAHTVIEFLK